MTIAAEMTTENANLKQGDVLRSRYEVLERVGQGGMGAVYQAEDLRLTGRLCALKEIRPEPGASEKVISQTQEQFRQEASILARLDHPNLPKVSDYFSLNGRDYLVMDFVRGHDLKELVDRARRHNRFLGEEQVLAWMQQICDALEYLHGQDPPILHRDIKPANIKLTPGGHIKLVDFGLVKTLDLDDPRTVTAVQGVGSLPYTALEQYAGDLGHTDVRSDIYALGATLYHLLTGRAPATAQERFLRPNVLQPPSEINRNVSSLTESAILQSMALHPDDRPDSVDRFRQELFGRTMEGEPTSTMSPAPSPWETALRENAGLIALALTLLLLSVLLTAF